MAQGDRTYLLVFGTSVVIHAALGWWIVRLDRPESPPKQPVRITMREIEPEPEPTPAPLERQEPEPIDEPEPVAEEAVPDAEPEAAPEPPPPAARPSPPKPAPNPSPPAATASAGDGSALDLGIELGNGAGPGIGVGDAGGGGTGGGAGKRGKPLATKQLAAKGNVASKADGCAEEEIKPKPTKLPRPEYTAAARAAGIEGKVRLTIHVDESGNVTRVDVVESLDPGLDEAAKTAALATTFEPASRCGKPAAGTLRLAIRFTL